MAISPRAFLVELYEEHLEEASFLYQQRKEYLASAELGWLDIADIESRMEAHLDGLVVGGQLAVDVCKRRAIEGDIGEVHAAVRVFCRVDLRREVFELLALTSPDDKERLIAIGDALNLDLPLAWSKDVIQLLNYGHSHLISILAEICLRRRISAVDALMHAAERADGDGIAALLRAVNGAATPSQREKLLTFIQSGDTRVAASAAIALLKLGESRALAICVRSARNGGQWACIPMALAGDQTLAPLMFDYIRAGSVASDTIIALGLLGDIAAVDLLLPLLADESLAPIVGVSLQLITGANLREAVFVERPVDVDELFDDELERHRAGEKIIRPDGMAYGENVERMSLDAPMWNAWWHQHRSHFQPTIRYRNGRPYSPGGVIGSLASNQTPSFLRALIGNELCIRYGVEFPFSVDDSVDLQRSQIRQMALWAKAVESNYQTGVWAFQGRVIPISDQN